MHRFRGKLNGATARLFAAVCEQFVAETNTEGNDPPECIPIFNQLSPQQRVSLARDVMIGLLCDDEPLPPNTIQHSATYFALLETLSMKIECEFDNICYYEIRDELTNLREEFTSQQNYSICTKEEQEERAKAFLAIEERAQRKKDCLERRTIEIPFVVKERTDEEFSRYRIKRHKEIRTTLFQGRPVKKEVRESLRQSLTEDEKIAFYWRLLVDEALQEQTESFLGPLMPPLCAVDFDFRCCNMIKWGEALDLLFVTPMCRTPSQTEHHLIFGEIDFRDYADSSQHPRIQAVEKNVKILRAVYDNNWDPKTLGDDQRCIYGVCSDEVYFREEHSAWFEDFLNLCLSSGIVISPQGAEEPSLADLSFNMRGDYQRRLNIYRSLKKKHTGQALCVPIEGYNKSPWCIPSEYKHPDSSGPFIRCSGPGEPLEFHGVKVPNNFGCRKKENLKQCTGCQVVNYCSRECQLKDWKRHKKECKQLALLGKDKKKVIELARTL